MTLFPVNTESVLGRAPRHGQEKASDSCLVPNAAAARSDEFVIETNEDNVVLLTIINGVLCSAISFLYFQLGSFCPHCCFVHACYFL